MAKALKPSLPKQRKKAKKTKEKAPKVKDRKAPKKDTFWIAPEAAPALAPAF